MLILTYHRNMFLAAGPYFQLRFQGSKSLLNNFQATEQSISTIANLGSITVLTKLQANASYPRRIVTSLLINIVAFTLLAFSTKAFLYSTSGEYFIFVMVIVFASSLATGLMQNGCFAFAAGFNQPKYIQAILTGQAIAGVLPPAVQILSVLSTDDHNDGARQESSNSALAYFLVAVAIALITFVAFFLLARSQNISLSARPRDMIPVEHEDEETEPTLRATRNDIAEKKSVPLLYLARKLIYPWTAVFVNFAVSMLFPVFTQQIVSIDPGRSRLLQKSAFIPLAFLMWNIGDLLGRIVPLSRRLNLASKPRILLVMAVVRAAWIPLYLLCNIQPADGPASVSKTVRSDMFYLLAVQFPFGLSNGYIGSCTMMGAGDFVEEGEREAAGGFMSLMLVAGLTVGSLASFLVGNIA